MGWMHGWLLVVGVSKWNDMAWHGMVWIHTLYRVQYMHKVLALVVVGDDLGFGFGFGLELGLGLGLGLGYVHSGL